MRMGALAVPKASARGVGMALLSFIMQKTREKPLQLATFYLSKYFRSRFYSLLIATAPLMASGPSPVQQRVLVAIIDGLGDVNIPGLGELSPLEGARTPLLDALACGGLTGIYDPVEPGLACGSDTAHLSILGYDPRVYYRGRVRDLFPRPFALRAAT